MYGLPHEQVCPYCEYEVEDHQSNWSDEEEEVICVNCDKEYKVRAVYQFKGFQVDKKCEKCGEWSDDGIILCDCEDECQ